MNVSAVGAAAAEALTLASFIVCTAIALVMPGWRTVKTGRPAAGAAAD